jgi:exosortase/archaeosortase family protein
VAGHRVSVQEACNGVRYLLSLGFIAVVYAYLSDSKPWMRFALLAVVVPIAIVANAPRVATSALVPALDAGTPHAVAGCLVFALCLATLVLTNAPLVPRALSGARDPALPGGRRPNLEPRAAHTGRPGSKKQRGRDMGPARQS